MNGMIFDIQELTFHDGPGARITFFLKGCPLRCLWCHNPEGQNAGVEIMYKEEKCVHCNSCQSFKYPSQCPTNALSTCGFEMTSEDVAKRVIALKESLDLLEGGVTFSGGEPCAQPDFLLECLTKLKKLGIHTAIETCGYCDSEIFKKIIDVCDYIMMDLKLMDPEQHIKYTGVSNEVILENAKYLKESGKTFRFRTPLIEGITDTESNLGAIKSFIQDLPWELLPYNKLAGVKYKQLKRKYFLE